MVSIEKIVLFEGFVESNKPVDAFLQEQLTPGLEKILIRNGVKMRCKVCGFPIPIYTGRYPLRCPQCNSLLELDSFDTFSGD